jgi:Protein of unknown function (DUF3160)
MCTTLCRLSGVLAICGLAIQVLAGVSVAQDHREVPSSAPATRTTFQATPYEGMFQLYGANRQQGIGNYVTVDFILTAYSLLVQDLLTAVEEETLYTTFRDLIATLVTTLQQQESQPPEHRLALAYVAVLHALLQPGAAPPPEVTSQVQAEMVLINAHQGIATSAITGVREDYSQYVPRGHYTRSEALQRYFRALLYAGRVGFVLRESKATEVSAELAERHTAAALLLSRILVEQDSLRTAYDSMQRLLDFFVGPSDDLTPAEYIAAAGSLPPAQARQQILTSIKHAGRLPRILSAIVDKERLETDRTLAEVVAGFRLLAQRYTPEAETLQELVYDRVTMYRGKQAPFTLSVINGKQVRGFPSALDVMASLGSQTALQMLTVRGDTAYDGYSSQLAAMTARVRERVAHPVALSGMHLQLLRTLLTTETRERLNAALGMWVHTRHTLLLYTKQSYTPRERSLSLSPARTLAAIEPAIEVYDALLVTLTQLAATLQPAGAKSKVTAFAEIVRQLRLLSTKQPLGGVLQEQQDIAYVNEVDQRLRGLLSAMDAPVVVDIHTEPNSQAVLEEGLGYPLVVEAGGKLLRQDVARGGGQASGPTLPRGARFNWYEFKHPMDQRLTDEAWQVLLKKGQAGESLSLQLLQIGRQVQ